MGRYALTIWDSTWTLSKLSTGLALYIKSDSGVTKDENNKISIWADQPGNGYNLTQTIENNRPTWTTGGQNGYPKIDGINDYMTSMAAGLLAKFNGNDTPFSLFFFRLVGGVTYGQIFSNSETADRGSGGMHGCGGTLIKYCGKIDDIGVSKLIQSEDPSPILNLELTIVLFSSVINLWTNGFHGIVNGDMDVGNCTANRFDIGVDYPNLDVWFNGSIYELGVSSGLFLPRDRKNLAKYFRHKYLTNISYNT